MKKQLLSILLVLVMIIGIIPIHAIAEDTGSGSSQTESYGEFTDGEQVIGDMIEQNGMYAHPRMVLRIMRDFANPLILSAIYGSFKYEQHTALSKVCKAVLGV